MKKKNYIIIISSSSYDCAAMSVCVRRLYKMNYVLFVCLGPNLILAQ